MFRVKQYWVNSRPEYSEMVISEQGLASGLQPTVHPRETSFPDTLFDNLGTVRISFSRLVRASPASSTPGPSPLILSQTRVPGLQALSCNLALESLPLGLACFTLDHGWA